MSDDKITEIGISFKAPVEDTERMLTLVPRSYSCIHRYVIDQEADVVACSRCDKTFNPMAVLAELAKQESRWAMNRKHYQEEMKRLEDRKRTKCQKCGHMTRISGR